MNLSKYLIARDALGLDHPVIFDTFLQHATMVPRGCHAISAGFVCREDGHIVIPEIDSESLHLGPRPEDKQLLTNFLS